MASTTVSPKASYRAGCTKAPLLSADQVPPVSSVHAVLHAQNRCRLHFSGVNRSELKQIRGKGRVQAAGHGLYHSEPEGLLVQGWLHEGPSLVCRPSLAREHMLSARWHASSHCRTHWQGTYARGYLRRSWPQPQSARRPPTGLAARGPLSCLQGKPWVSVLLSGMHRCSVGSVAGPWAVGTCAYGKAGHFQAGHGLHHRQPKGLVQGRTNAPLRSTTL